MSNRILAVLLLTVALLGALARPSAAQSAPVYDPANGHWYQLVRVPAPINWPDARSAAQALVFAGYAGHLATITSANERKFINANVTSGTLAAAWRWTGFR